MGQQIQQLVLKFEVAMIHKDLMAVRDPLSDLFQQLKLEKSPISLLDLEEGSQVNRKSTPNFAAPASNNLPVFAPGSKIPNTPTQL